jgi:hypothetical protein
LLASSFFVDELVVIFVLSSVFVLHLLDKLVLEGYTFALEVVGTLAEPVAGAPEPATTELDLVDVVNVVAPDVCVLQ